MALKATTIIVGLHIYARLFTTQRFAFATVYCSFVSFSTRLLKFCLLMGTSAVATSALAGIQLSII